MKKETVPAAPAEFGPWTAARFHTQEARDRFLETRISAENSYVSRRGHDYSDDIEERERAGTPGVLQIIKAALAYSLQKKS